MTGEAVRAAGLVAACVGLGLLCFAILMLVSAWRARDRGDED